MTEDEVKAEIAELDRQIDGATGWGAWLGAVVERRDGLARSIGLPPRRLVDGKPLAD